ncbi:MAG: hypothetical protein MOGMAGMI_02525 [Candidatus Omnitrophica bacterium]|nr:hypothetical protein [Candidatus Omnitrophota bacterium]
MVFLFRLSDTRKMDEAYVFCFFRLDACDVRLYSLN